MNTRKHLTVKRLTGAIVAAATMTAVLLVAPSTMASEPSALDKYKNESSLLVDLNFNDLTAGQTGTYQSGNIVASINGQTATGTGEDGTIAANLSSGFWMSLTSADGSAVLQGKHAITISYDSKPASSGNSGWTLYAARDAAKPTYGYEHYIGFLDKTDKITFERYNNTTGGRTGANVSGASSVGWKHVDVVVSDESTTMYVNGTLVNSVEAKESHDLTEILGKDGGILQLGKANWGAEYFTGLIDNFKIYDSSLAAATDAFNAISVAQEATENFSVITESNGVPIVWSSDNNAIRFTEDGTAQVTRPAVGEADAVATLTAKLNGSDDQLRTFKVTVPHIISDDEKIQSDLDAVNILDADDIRSNFVVPTVGDNGSAITWSVKNDGGANASIAEGYNENNAKVSVNRPAAGKDSVNVTLEATATNNGATANREFPITVSPMPSDQSKDEAYIWAFFTGEGVGGEKISLAASKGNNALDWNTLNEGTPLFTSTEGEQGLRDPFIMRSHDGDTFYMLATDLKISGRKGSFSAAQYNGSLYIEVWESNDLVNWTNQRHIKVSDDSAGNTWAPEAYWDDELGEYVVYWASNLYDNDDSSTRTSPSYNRMMYVTTPDFITFSKPKTWIDVDRRGQAGAGSIDVTVQKEGDTYYRIYKDEKSMTLRQEKSNTLTDSIGKAGVKDYSTALSGSSWSEVGTAIGNDKSNGYGGTFSAGEGPSLFKANEGDVNGYQYYLFADQPSYHGGPNHYVPMATTDISDASKWTVIGDKMPEENFPVNSDGGKPRHGTVVPVTRAQYQTVLEAYAPSIAVKSVASVDVSTNAGTAPTMPETVHLTMADGSEQDADVQWDDIDADQYAKAGTFTVKGTAQDDSRMPVEATVTVSKPDDGKDDPKDDDAAKKAGYLWLYFNASDYEKINYGYSKNGLKWQALNDGEAIMSSTQGTKGIRDPHLIRLEEPDADGNKYVMLGTDLHAEGSASGGSWNQINASTYLVVAKSKDLVIWTDPELVSTGLEGKVGNAWAPEAIWDAEAGKYLVYWSSRDLSTGGDNPTTGNTALKVYKAYTSDFTTFENPQIWIDQSSADLHNIIDTTIVQGDDGSYYRFSTSDWYTVIDTADSLEAQKWTRLVERDSEVNADGTSKITGDKVVKTSESGLSTRIEGLTVYQGTDGAWIVMGDNGGYAGWTIAKLSSLKKSGTFSKASANFGQRFRHGTVVRLNVDEETAVLAAYGEHTAPNTPLAQQKNPIAQFTFDDEETGYTSDLAVAGIHGTAKLEDGNNGTKAARLGSGSWLSVTQTNGAALLLDATEFTVSYDAKPDSNGNTGWTFYAAPSTAAPTYNQSEHYIGVLDKVGSVVVERYNTDGNRDGRGNASATTSGDGWHNVTVTVNAKATRVYIDGVLAGESTDVSGLGVKEILGETGGILQIGKANWGSGEYYSGLMDNLTIWNRTLNANEIAQRNNAPALASITVGTVPTSSQADALRGTDKHSNVRTSMDCDAKTITSVVNNRAEINAVPVTFALTYDDASVTVDGKSFASGDKLDMSKKHTLVIECSDGNGGIVSEKWTLEKAVQSNNPVLPGQYADPDIDYFDGKFWIFPTTDGFSGWSGNYFHAFSSTDLVNWTDEGVILDVDKNHEPTTNGDENTAISPWSVGSAWAPTIEKKNGKYYFYYCAKLESGESAIGVAVADSPAGPYKAAKDPIVTRSMEGVTVGQAIDPSIFTDDDGTSYILYGNGSAAIAQLSDDMMSVVPGTVKRINGLNNFRESVVVSKRDGVYHWTWSCDDAGSANYHVEYGTSPSLFKEDGSVTDIDNHGVLLQKDASKNLQGTAHQSEVHVVDANGEERWFMAYHRHYTPLGVFTSGLGFHRETAIDEITFDENGLMQTINPTDEGVSITMAKTDALSSAVADAAAVVNNGYDSGKWDAFVEARDAAKLALSKALDEGLSQADVDEASEALTAAQASLKSDSDKPGDSDNSGGNSGNSAGNGKNNTASKTGNKVANTGSAVSGVIAVMVLLVGAGVVLRRCVSGAGSETR